jgi:hypothetical protein
MRIRHFIVPVLLCSGFVCARAFGGSVEVHVSSQDIFEGDTLTYEVHVKDLKGSPDLGETSKDFDVEAHGSQVMQNTFRMIVNGRDVSPEQSATTVYQYVLTPKRAGQLTIPAPTVVVDGHTYTGQPVPVHVIAVEKQDIALLEISTGKDHIYPTQQFDVTLRILLKPLPDNATVEPLSVMNAPELTANWVNPVPDGLQAESELQQWLNPYLHGNGRGFSLNGLRVNNMFMFDNQFAVLNLDKSRETRPGTDGRPINYFVYTLKRTFTALRTGTYTFGPAKMKGTFAAGIAPNGRNYLPKALLVVAPTKTVTCAMPEPRPANFSGCIGNFKLEATASAHDLRVGYPLTLKLDFERLDGNGPLDDIVAPDLSANAALARDFTIVDKAPTGSAKERHKTFAYTLRPKKAGVSIPAIQTSVFNTRSEKFEDMSSAPVALNVIDAPQLRPEELVAAMPSGHGARISGQEKGVFQNISDLSELNRPALNPLLYAGAVVGLWLGLALFGTVLTIQRKRAGDEVFQNRLRARTEAAAQLAAAREALKAGNTNAAALAAQGALHALIGYNGGVAPAGLTPADARAILERRRVSAECSGETLRLLESIEGAQYGALAGLAAQTAVETAEKLVPRLQKELEAKR